VTIVLFVGTSNHRLADLLAALRVTQTPVIEVPVLAALTLVDTTAAVVAVRLTEQEELPIGRTLAELGARLGCELVVAVSGGPGRNAGPAGCARRTGANWNLYSTAWRITDDVPARVFVRLGDVCVWLSPTLASS
jgi:hypothetical protein